jgi:hypothetical protein
MKGLYKTLLPLLIVLISKNLSAQNDTILSDTISTMPEVSSDWIDHGLIFGIDFSKYLYGEIDYYRIYIWEAGGPPFLSAIINCGVEFSYFDKLVLAPKIQVRFHAFFFNTSLSALCYTNLNQDYAVKLRPEIGISLSSFDINYGYNIGLYKNGFNQFNRHVVSLRYYLSLPQ